jgi:hypothetical protein
MRRGFAWLLGAALVSAALALWLPERAAHVVQVVEARRTTVLDAPQASGRAVMTAPLPAVLERLPVEPARRDPFAQEAPAVAPAVVHSPSVAVAAAPLPVPAPPPLEWRLMGTMATPEGQRIVVLAHSDEQRTVVAEAGVLLDGGYEVSAVSADAVRVVYPPLHAEVVIPIPPPPHRDR